MPSLPVLYAYLWLTLMVTLPTLMATFRPLP